MAFKSFLFALAFSFLGFSEHSLNTSHSNEKLGRPQFDGTSFFKKAENLTADEVNSGEWKLSEDGGCDLEKGCPYVNKQGEVRYLPNSEKSKLKKTEAKTKKLEKEVGPIPSGEISSHLKKLKDAGIKKVIIAYGDELTCPHCRDLGNSLRNALVGKDDVTIIKVNKVSVSELPDPSRKVIPQMKVMKWNNSEWVEGFKRASFPEAERVDILSKLLD
ncbi:MAG: hypothetical protein EBQ92_04875 [Proteobacteria bacterium]|nr:hypothetical protein [Pseudomonadota bacterium]